MNWASNAIAELRLGKAVQIRPRGNSMRGKVESGQLVTLEPCPDPKVGDLVLVKVNGAVFLHLVKARDGARVLIGNNRGRINGWANVASVYGVATRIEP